MQRCEGAQGKDAGGFIKKAKEDAHGRVDRLNEIARRCSWRISQSQDVFRHGEPGRLEAESCPCRTLIPAAQRDIDSMEERTARKG